jgi:D-sedoheptulose 7-phosphate isomerase
MDTRDKNKYFPIDPVHTVHDYLTAYVEQLSAAVKNMDKEKLHRAAVELSLARSLNRRVFVAGNGGSAAISLHLDCDFQKGCHIASTIRTVPLVANVALLTAIGNDIGYDDIFAYQLELADPSPGEVLILISSSGNSPNIIKAAKFAKSRQMTIIGFSGFDGGTLAKIADISLHVAFPNYGLVEDAHQILMHVLAQHHYLNLKTQNEIGPACTHN